MFQIVFLYVAMGSIILYVTVLFAFVRKRWQQKLKRTQRIIEYLHQNELLYNSNSDRCLGTTSKLTIGDITCRYNAQSRYLRCAINPLGSCDDCPHYEKL